jgi:predicted glycosyltransferase
MKLSAADQVNQGSPENASQPLASTSKRIWIDLDNSPHIPFFAPIVEELRKRGYAVTLTARDAYQVRELADLFRFKYRCIGRHWGKNRMMKLFGTCLRAVQLMPMIIRERPDLAVAHGSRSQIMVSAALGIRSLSIGDYEFTTVLGAIKPTWTMTPDIIPTSETVRKAQRILQYPGIKEDVYVPAFQPDSSIRSRLGMQKGKVVVALRPPASEAHYHDPKSDELFAATIDFLGNASGVQVILLPRNQRQAVSVRESWPAWFEEGKFSIPDHAEDGLNLMWHCDLVISGGGTMNREAAALGMPVYSIFRGKIGAVDRYLSDDGRLVLIESVEDLRRKIALVPWSRPAAPQSTARPAMAVIVDHIVKLAESK